MSILFKYLRIRYLINCLKCCAKVTTFVFWASVCLATIKLALFKSSESEDRDLIQGPLIGDDYVTEPGLQFEVGSEEYNAIRAELKERSWRVTQVCQKYAGIVRRSFQPYTWAFIRGARQSTQRPGNVSSRTACSPDEGPRIGLKPSSGDPGYKNKRLTNQKINSWEFLIDEKHNLVWCNIFKAASTLWLYKFNILGGYEKSYLLKSQDVPLRLARKKFRRPKPNTVQEAVSNPKTISLIVVRDPFVRLLSAYRDKLEPVRAPYRKMAKSIVKKYRQTAIKSMGPIKTPWPTFHEFVLYLLDHTDKLNMDEHAVPYYKFCTPCAVHFNVIAKVETLSRDNAYVIKTLGLEHLIGQDVFPRGYAFYRNKIMNKSKDRRNTTSLLMSYFNQLDEDMLDGLLQIYGLDFEMFDYDSNVYRKYVRKRLLN